MKPLEMWQGILFFVGMFPTECFLGESFDTDLNWREWRQGNDTM